MGPGKSSLFVVFLAATSLAASTAHAGPIDPQWLQGLGWRSIGPYRGGRVLAVTGVPDQPNRFYFGAVNGGVWRTDDAGRTWNPIFDQTGVGSIGAIAVAPSASNVLYVGTGEADMRSDIAQGVGAFRSDDGGASWAAIGLKDTQAIAKILVDPRDPNVLLVAALGHPYGPNPERGVFRSGDGGKTWTRTLFKSEDVGAIDLAFEPGAPDVVYAALWQTRRPPWNVYPPSSGPGGGLYRSTDGGKSWTALSGHGLPAKTGRIGLATTPADPARVYALIDGPQGGLYRSDDRGANWRRTSDDRRIIERGWYFSGVTANPKVADEVYVNDTIVLKSTDGGAHFIPLKGDPTGDDYHVLWIDPAQPDRRILGVDQGALVTLNGGKTWSSWFNQPTGQFYHVATDNQFPYHVYGSQQDSGAASVSERGDADVDGVGAGAFREITAGGESDEIAPDPKDPQTVFGGRVDKLDLKSGQTRSVDPTLAFPGAYRGTWTLPLVFSPSGDDLYFGDQRLFKTSDRGEHWTPISPDLTRLTLTVPPTLDPATAADTAEPGPRRGVIYDIGVSALSPQLIWAGTDDGLVWRTDDGGGHWRDVTPKTLTPWSKVGTVEPSYADKETAYLAIDRHRLDDFRPYVYRTRDGGRTWDLITDGLTVPGALNAVNVVREDPKSPKLLYAGTERGAFVSFDQGDHWQVLASGLPPTSVRDIKVHGDDLVIATHGRGFYVLDDIAPLRALAADARADRPRLLTPAPALRIHDPDFLGTPMPKDEPAAANPHPGAAIDYVLNPGAGPIQIEIFAASGALVRTYSSTDKAELPPPEKALTPPEWIAVSAPPSASPGGHRFYWDLHYPASPGADPDEKGPWAPPGAYKVVLKTAQGQSDTVLRIEPDPRLSLPQKAFEDEFALATKIGAARASVRQALKEAAAAKSALSARALKATPDQAKSIAASLARLQAISDVPRDDAANSVGVAAGDLDGLYDIGQRLDKLAQAVDGADASPSPDAVSGFAQAQAALSKATQKLHEFTRSLTPSI